MLKTFYVALFFILFTSCKQEQTNISKQSKEKTDSIQIGKTDTIKKAADTNIVQNSPPKDTVNVITFKEFANEFVKEAFKSEDNFSKYTESTFIVSSSNEDSRSNKKTNTQKEFNYLKSQRVGKKYAINKDMIYFYEMLEDMKFGMKFYFRKDSSDNWKLYKVYFEGL